MIILVMLARLGAWTSSVSPVFYDLSYQSIMSHKSLTHILSLPYACILCYIIPLLSVVDNSRVFATKERLTVDFSQGPGMKNI